MLVPNLYGPAIQPRFPFTFRAASADAFPLFDHVDVAHDLIGVTDIDRPTRMPLVRSTPLRCFISSCLVLIFVASQS